MSWGINLVLAAFWLGGVIGIALLIRVIAAWRDYRREQDPKRR